MLDEIYNSCKTTADQLVGWDQLNKNEIANLYLINRHNECSSIYAAALLCKYWYKVGLLWKNNCKSMTQEDCYWIVWDGIERAMDYAPWVNPENALYLDPNGPDKAINVCIDSIKKIYYTFSNRDKRKVYYATQSLDTLWELTGDYAAGLVEDSTIYTDEDTQNLNIKLLIDKLIADNLLPEAIVVDTICFEDSVLRTSDGQYSFSERRLVSTIHRLQKDYAAYFAKQYGVDELQVLECLTQINSLSYALLHKLVDRTLYVITHLEAYKYVY